MIQVVSILVLIGSVIIHELAHGWIAEKFGDPTARALGRLTLNPIPHIDPVGSIIVPGILLLTGVHFFIGWAKPVPVNPQYFQNPSRDMMWVALAGPLSNITLMTLAVIVFKLIMYSGASLNPVVASGTFSFLVVVIQINLVLAIFNLIPIPPLDGSRVVANFISPTAQATMYKYEAYGMVIIMAAAYFGLFTPLFVYGNHLIEYFLLSS